MIEYHYDIIQGEDEWFALRCGKITASEFGTVMASGRGGGESKTRRDYMLRLIGERLTGKIAGDKHSNAHMERGKAMEPEARQLYQLTTGMEVAECGFISRGDIGYSPDGIVSDEGLLEIKTKLPHLHLDVLLKNEVPPEHVPQCQGGLWVTEREWIDFVSYWPGLPIFIKRLYRDESKIAEIADAVKTFSRDLLKLQARIELMT